MKTHIPHTHKLILALAVVLLLAGTAVAGERTDGMEAENAPALLYMGQASIRITTEDGKVIYIDPYAGTAEQYASAADLILVTHTHFDHSAVEKVKNRADGCKIITHKEAVVRGKHQTFDLGFVRVEAVEADYNRWHDVRECAGYVLTFRNGAKITGKQQ